jgi:simple sugar transport system ATP-binding protein
VNASVAPAQGAATDHLIDLVGITKRFPGVVANDSIDLTIRAGEVQCILGENGAGKSTLIGILSGMLRPDAGVIRLRGEPVTVNSPRRAITLGIGTVYQHSSLVPTLTVIENLMLGAPWNRCKDVAGARTRLAELSRLLGVDADADAVTGRLALGQQQQVEIIKALWRGEGVLILDEPTSMLTPQGARDLGQVMRRLRDGGLAIIFISHKLNEAIEFGDRISVLRRGRLVGALAPSDLAAMNAEQATRAIIAMMFASEEDATAGAGPVAAARHPAADSGSVPMLELVNVSTAGDRGGAGVDGVSFALRPGEIFGIAGVDGNGQKELAEVIAGQRPISGGDIRLAGRPVGSLSVGERQSAGLRYVTDDRHGEGTVGSFSVALNLLLKRIGEPPFWRHGIVRPRAIDENARRLIARHDVHTPSEHTPIAALSGGNIQKALLARELAMQPKAVVFNKPTYGLDVRNMRDAWDRIRAQADAGVATVVISTELDELLTLCDRIGVMFGGRLRGIVDNGPDAQRRVGEMMVGAGRS